MKKILFIAVAALMFNSCISELTNCPELNPVRPDAKELTKHSKLLMNGVYQVLEGKEILGEEIACKWVNDALCIWCSHDVVYSENHGGIDTVVNNSIILSGYYRVVRSGSGDLMDLSINSDEGAHEIINYIQASSIIIRGKTHAGKMIILKRIRPLYIDPGFYILAHRGGGRNSERLGISENSIEMIRHSENMGAMGVEIDVKSTRDGKAILFHDDTFSPRTVQGAYLLGRVNKFTLEQITTIGRLVNGEKIPTLREALKFIIDETGLQYVWLDIKDPAIVDEAVTIQCELVDYAKEIGNPVEILFGIPDEDILNKFNNCTKHTNVLVEKTEFLNRVDSCKVYAPRWTDQITHYQGVKTFTWTLDVKDYIRDFLYNEKVDGVLTNYPSLIAGMQYTRINQ